MKLSNGQVVQVRTNWVDYDGGNGQMARIAGTRELLLDGEPSTFEEVAVLVQPGEETERLHALLSRP